MDWNVVFAVSVGLLTGVVLTLVSTYISTTMNLRATTRAATARARIELSERARLDQEAKAFDLRLNALREFRDAFADMASHLRLVVSRVQDAERLSALGRDIDEAWHVVNVEYAMFIRKNSLVVTALNKTGDARLEEHVARASDIMSEVGRLVLGRSPYQQTSEKASQLYPIARQCVQRIDDILESQTAHVRRVQAPV